MQAKKRFAVLSLLAAFGMALQMSAAIAADVGTQARPLTIAAGHFFGYLPAYRVADELNKAGVVTKLIDFPSATERLEAVAAGYADMSYAGLTASVLLRARGKKVVVVASADQKGRALVSNNSIQTIAQLKGKTIGVTFGSIEQMTLIALLRKNGLDANTDVKIINVPTTDLPVALQGGQIDAFMAFEPWSTFALKKFGAHLLAYPYDTELGAIDGGIQAEEGFVHDHPDLVRKVIAAQIEAVKYYQQHPDDIVQAGVKNFNIDADIMKAALNNVELTYALDPAPIKGLAKFQLDMGLISQAEYDSIDWAAFINTSFVDALIK
jgi:NitT/TauT family transport system substrate-binding protein